ncbi:hypothetical protein DBT_1072 [Dissulfuribacter thermophilus]|uniref:Uncharacterized protein n=1 Tax=Dissulfuribacter thermophilus TaxID=1156395 RepID=A0A1B9F7I3_9BACT|nr:hypothetical protein DBT_1072 [Dissulfuribacter thermophilus]
MGSILTKTVKVKAMIFVKQLADIMFKKQFCPLLPCRI